MSFMNLLSNMGWLGKSVTAMVSIIPIMLFFNTFSKFGMKPEVTTFTWFIGVAIGILLIPTGISPLKVEGLVVSDFAITKPMLIMLFLGITFGSVANILLFQAVPISPNPALPFAILGLASVIAYVLCPVAGVLLPKLFPPVSLNWVNLSGLVLLAMAVAMVMYKSPTS